MRVVVGERLGGPEVLGIAEREAPRPGPGEVVVDVAAAGVNYMDIYQREGVGNYRTEPPFVPGAGLGKSDALNIPARYSAFVQPLVFTPDAGAFGRSQALLSAL